MADNVIDIDSKTSDTDLTELLTASIDAANDVLNQINQ